MRPVSDGRFLPDKPVTMVTVHRSIVLALGMRSTANQINHLRTRDGVAFATPQNLGTTNLGNRLNLRYPSAEADHDVTPQSPMPRAQVAYSIYKAKTLAPWVTSRGSAVTTKASSCRTWVPPAGPSSSGA